MTGLGDLAAYAVATVFAVLACLVLLLVIAADIVALRDWHRARRADALILERLGSVTKKGYGRGSRERWTRYRVRSAGLAWEGEVLDKRRDLAPGGCLELRYLYDKHGELEIQDPSVVSRIRTFLIVLPLGILWAAACIILTK